MRFTQFRAPSVGGATLSKLWLNGAHICDICEDEVREIPGAPVSDWKIYGVTAIPTGLYRITLEDSVHFGPNTLTVTGVPGYEHIRIHGGNTSADTEGCLLPGTRNSASTVASSQAALRVLHAIIEPEIDAGGTVMWEILPAPMEA
jgi:hypothetical protein